MLSETCLAGKVGRSVAETSNQLTGIFILRSK